jgi:hypothetical protein
MLTTQKGVTLPPWTLIFHSQHLCGWPTSQSIIYSDTTSWQYVIRSKETNSKQSTCVQKITKYSYKAYLVINKLFAQNTFLIIVYFNCKWIFTWWQWYYNKTLHTNNTHRTKQHTTLKQNRAHKTTQTIRDTLHTMNKMQIQLQSYKLTLIKN